MQYYLYVFAFLITFDAMKDMEQLDDSSVMVTITVQNFGMISADADQVSIVVKEGDDYEFYGDSIVQYHFLLSLFARFN